MGIQTIKMEGSDRRATSKMSGQNWTIYSKGSKLEACPQIAVNLRAWTIIMGKRKRVRVMKMNS